MSETRDLIELEAMFSFLIAGNGTPPAAQIQRIAELEAATKQ